VINLAKEMREATQRGDALGLIEAELAFYVVLAMNESARDRIRVQAYLATVWLSA